MISALTSSLTAQLGIRYPIVQGPIGSATCPELVAAVSNAGALGMLALSWTPVEQIADIIAETRRLTTRPFGVNLVLVWDQRARLEQCLAAGVRIVSFSWGDSRNYTPIVHEAGGLVLDTVHTADDALRAVGGGADVIIAQGWEAGGHVLGQVTTLVLTPAVVSAVAPTPVVAAGGIADGRGLAAVLALGASGGVLGTRFLATPESAAHEWYKQAIVRATEADTIYTGLFNVGWDHAPHRVLRNSTVHAWEAAGAPSPPHRPGEDEVLAHRHGRPLVRYGDDIPHRETHGEVEALALYAGQSAGLVNAIRPADSIVQEIMHEATLALQRATKSIVV